MAKSTATACAYPHALMLSISTAGELADCPSLRASDEDWFIWSISSIWFVWSMGLKIHSEKPDGPDRPANQTDGLLRVARAQKIISLHSLLPSLLVPFSGGGLVDPRMGASSDDWFSWSIPSIWFVWSIGLKIHSEEPDGPDRPANQTDESMRVPRAGGRPGCPFPLSCGSIPACHAGSNLPAYSAPLPHFLNL